MPRPSAYTAELAKEICDRLSAGEPLAQICRDEHMPSTMTISRWTRDDGKLFVLTEDGAAVLETFGIAYAHAREVGFDQIALDALAIADETIHDTKKVGEDQREVADSEWISRSRLRVDTRLKLLAKWDPKRYGDKQLIGSDPDNPLPQGFTVNLVRSSGGEG